MSDTNFKRDKTLDILRLIAMSGVLLDHYLCRFGNVLLTKFCLYLGGVSVCLFLCLTAFIYGMKWRHNDRMHFDVGRFFKSRFQRIVIPLWIVILLAFLLDCITSQSVDYVAYLYNIVGLGWFRQINVGGHLWYITILFLLYVALLLFSFVRLDRLHIGFLWIALAVLSVFYIWHPSFLLPICKSSAPLVLVYAVLLFFKGDEILRFFGKHLIIFCLILLVLLSVIVLTVFCLQPETSFANSPTLLMLGYNFGFLLFCTMVPMLDKLSTKSVHLFAVDESYEIYLVHTFVAFLVSLFVNNELLFLSIWLFLTYLLARFICILQSELRLV